MKGVEQPADAFFLPTTPPVGVPLLNQPVVVLRRALPLLGGPSSLLLLLLLVVVRG